ncbi:2OG-Fe(II) oxygenase family protein [Azospira restricta]|uniref:2OG-Fe(II) oxygenase family protein n=1 Tax=Azospira restricta TaxID=404405 RepID=A0A974PWA0_9RHOO|nr:2OG-Fe(II) oxygenase family protein [Azospira restricta]QRJ62374.1 2OG-Fe(II) oxygenase family protein [Azospira restricta]
MVKKGNPWVEASDVIPMFPTLVWKLQLKAEIHDAIDARILAMLEEARRDLPEIGLGQGWQSDQTLHERKELQELVSCIRNATKSVLQFLRIADDAFEITGCWATVLAKGAMHRAHSHPNNFLSGVYYVRTQQGADAINFHDPRHQASVIRPPVVELTAENTDQVVVRVTNGTLLLFPSYLEHSVDSNTSEEKRISLSFNIMFTSFTEKLSRPLW